MRAAHVDYTQTIMCRPPISKSIYHRAQRRKSLADDNVQTFHYNHTRAAQIKALQTIMYKLPAVKTHLSHVRSASKPPAEDMTIPAA